MAFVFHDYVCCDMQTWSLRRKNQDYVGELDGRVGTRNEEMRDHLDHLKETVGHTCLGRNR